MAKTRIINGGEAAGLLTMEACIEAMDQTLRAVSAGEIHMLQRYMLPQEKGNKFALMGADDLSLGVCAAKVIVFPRPEAKANHTNKGIVPLFDSSTGALKAIVDAECITAVRTAAASAAATRLLAGRTVLIWPFWGRAALADSILRVSAGCGTSGPLRSGTGPISGGRSAAAGRRRLSG